MQVASVGASAAPGIGVGSSADLSHTVSQAPTPDLARSQSGTADSDDDDSAGTGSTPSDIMTANNALQIKDADFSTFVSMLGLPQASYTQASSDDETGRIHDIDMLFEEEAAAAESKNSTSAQTLPSQPPVQTTSVLAVRRPEPLQLPGAPQAGPSTPRAAPGEHGVASQKPAVAQKATKVKQAATLPSSGSGAAGVRPPSRIAHRKAEAIVRRPSAAQCVPIAPGPRPEPAPPPPGPPKRPRGRPPKYPRPDGAPAPKKPAKRKAVTTEDGDQSRKKAATSTTGSKKGAAKGMRLGITDLGRMIPKNASSEAIQDFIHKHVKLFADLFMALQRQAAEDEAAKEQAKQKAKVKQPAAKDTARSKSVGALTDKPASGIAAGVEATVRGHSVPPLMGQKQDLAVADLLGLQALPPVRRAKPGSSLSAGDTTATTASYGTPGALAGGPAGPSSTPTQKLSALSKSTPLFAVDDSNRSASESERPGAAHSAPVGRDSEASQQRSAPSPRHLVAQSSKDDRMVGKSAAEQGSSDQSTMAGTSDARITVNTLVDAQSGTAGVEVTSEVKDEAGATDLAKTSADDAVPKKTAKSGPSDALALMSSTEADGETTAQVDGKEAASISYNDSELAQLLGISISDLSHYSSSASQSVESQAADGSAESSQHASTTQGDGAADGEDYAMDLSFLFDAAHASSDSATANNAAEQVQPAADADPTVAAAAVTLDSLLNMAIPAFDLAPLFPDSTCPAPPPTPVAAEISTPLPAEEEQRELEPVTPPLSCLDGQEQAAAGDTAAPTKDRSSEESQKQQQGEEQHQEQQCKENVQSEQQEQSEQKEQSGPQQKGAHKEEADMQAQQDCQEQQSLQRKEDDKVARDAGADAAKIAISQLADSAGDDEPGTPLPPPAVEATTP